MNDKDDFYRYAIFNPHHRILVHEDMTLHVPIFLRACTQVTLVAWNVTNVARGDYGMAALSGFAISWVWWANSRTAALSEAPYGRVVYAAGAGVGTVLGMVIGRWL